MRANPIRLPLAALLLLVAGPALAQTPVGPVPRAAVGAANGVAPLDGSSKVPVANLPAASSGALGIVRGDGTTITNLAGVLSAVGGGGSGTVGSCTSGQLPYYSATGTTLACLTVGTNLSISGGTLNASGAGAATIPVTSSTCSSALTLNYPTHGTAAYDVSVTGACTLSLAGGTASEVVRLIVYLRQDSTGHAVNLPSSATWASGVTPTPSSGASMIDRFQFETPDTGTTNFGSY